MVRTGKKLPFWKGV